VIPKGLDVGPSEDQNAHCIFKSSYPPALSGELSEEEVEAHLNDRVYEKVLRSAFFNIALSYPRQTFELFLYYKSKMIFSTLRESVSLNLSAQTATALAFAGLQFAVFVVFVASGAYRGNSEITPNAGIMFVLFAFSLLPLYVAWSFLNTSTDTITFMYAGLAITVGVFIQTTIEQIFRTQKSNMSILLSSAAHRRTEGVFVVLIMCAVAWAANNYFAPDDMKTAPLRVVRTSSQILSSTRETPVITRVTDSSELPPLSEVSAGPDRWDLIEGLNAELFQGSAVISGQRILRLVAVGTDGRHALGVRFGELAPDQVYRAIAWVKAEPGVRVMIEARDSNDSHTGKPSNYGVTQFDLATRSVVNSNGDILASGVEAAADDWVKLWVDLRSRDGQTFVSIGLLEGPNNRHVFTAAGQSVFFGGFEIFRRNF
jgi:hypothetical protein